MLKTPFKKQGPIRHKPLPIQIFKDCQVWFKLSRPGLRASNSCKHKDARLRKFFQNLRKIWMFIAKQQQQALFHDF